MEHRRPSVLAGLGPRRPSAGALLLAAVVVAVASAADAGPGELRAPQEGAAQARRRASEILARPEFRPEPRSLVERALDKIGELFNKILGGVGNGSPLLAWGAVAVLSGLLGLLLWRAARALQNDTGRAGAIAVDGRRRPPADWRAEAAGHEAAGRWRDALRCSWREVVAELAARSLVEEVPGRTTGEYRAGVARSLPAAAEPFAHATRLFEDAWYAAVEVGPDEVAQERALGDQVLAEARGRA